VRYQADPPTVEKIVAIMRHTADDRHGWRLRALIVVLWRAELRTQEALALAEPPPSRGAPAIVRRARQGVLWRGRRFRRSSGW
jgi:hypothetical protein